MILVGAEGFQKTEGSRAEIWDCFEPKEAREEYEIAPENHRPKTDLNQFAERALQCGNNPFMRSLPKAGSKAKK